MEGDREAFILTSKSSTELICFWRKHRDSFKIADCPIHQLIRLDRQEIHIALSNSDIDVRILAQGYCAAIVSLSLL